MKVFGFSYLIGNPEIRNKILYVLRLIGMSVVLGYACIGFGVFLYAVCQILAW